MATERTAFLTPVGRLVQGSLYRANDKDAEGRPLVSKSGANAGQPRVDYYFALAIPKGAETHWNQTAWGQVIYSAGQKAFPNGAFQSPSFAWKITDGDSAIPDKKGVKPCSREGFPGNWILRLSSGFAPKVCNADGSQMLTEPDFVKLGYFIQVYASVGGNGSAQQPGVFLNHNAVAFAGYGEEIHVGMDTAAIGFGGGALPAGASATPTAQAPAIPPAPAPAPAPAPTPAPEPHPGFLAGPTMTAKAAHSYQKYREAGWTDDQLRAQGLMV